MSVQDKFFRFQGGEDVDRVIDDILSRCGHDQSDAIAVIGKRGDWSLRYFPEDGAIHLGSIRSGYDKVDFERRLRRDGYTLTDHWFANSHQRGGDFWIKVYKQGSAQ
jgi:hypothetical protein